MAASSQPTIGTTPVLIAQSKGTPIQVQLHTTAAVYFGGSDVTTSTGFRLDNNDKATITLADSDSLYAVQGSGTSTLYVLTTIL
jgi:hypothetical protein